MRPAMSTRRPFIAGGRLVRRRSARLAEDGGEHLAASLEIMCRDRGPRWDWDVPSRIRGPAYAWEVVAVFMAGAFEAGDGGSIVYAPGLVARAKGMTEITKRAGLSRERPYGSFGECGSPAIKRTPAAMKAPGYRSDSRDGARRES